jgi:hypothetical protein
MADSIDMKRVRLVSLVAPGLLALVASLAVYRVQAHDQSTWSGVGFGMFATIDNETTRQIRAELSTGGERRPVAVPAELEEAARGVAVVPTLERLEALARRWVDRDEVPPGATLAVALWEMRFDAGDKTVEVVPVLSTEVTG